FPIPDGARPVLPLYPTILELSRYELKVTGLKPGTYKLLVDGKQLISLSDKELSAGVNLTAYGQGPLADQGKAVLTAVAAKETLVGQWRALSRTASSANAPDDAKARLADLTKKVEEADAKIR